MGQLAPLPTLILLISNTGYLNFDLPHVYFVCQLAGVRDSLFVGVLDRQPKDLGFKSPAR